MAPKTDIFLKKPTGSRASFAIIRRYDRGLPTQRHEQVYSEALATINKLYKDGTYTLAQATKAVKAEIARLKLLQADKPTVNAANMKILDRYWAARYESKELADKQSAYNRLRRAVEVVGSLHLSSATQSQLQRVVNTTANDLKSEARGVGKNQRETVAALNQILKFIGRDIKLVSFKKNRRKVRYVTLEQFEKIVSFVEDKNIANILWAAFSTGGRVGELFALKTENIKNGTVWIDSQIDRSFNERETKNRRPHRAPIVPEGMRGLLAWAGLSFKEKIVYRNYNLARIVGELSVRAGFEKIVFHDLRHSYAIHLLGRGVPIDLVAQALGDSVQVAQEHYLGFALTDIGVEAVVRLLK